MKEIIFLCVVLLALFDPKLTQAEIHLMREGSTVIQSGSLGSVIQDNGVLKKAIAASNNRYIFADDTPTGAQALVLIGTSSAILDYLAEHPTRGIENRIKDLPDIYMGISEYKPRQRFEGLFPFHDFMSDFSKAVAAIGPSFAPEASMPAHTLTDAAGALGDFINFIKAVAHKKKAGTPKEKIFYVKFSYLQEPGMIKIGTQSVTFQMILEEMRKTMK